MSTVFERRLIRMGNGGLVVSLPKAWITYYQLKAGDRVFVIANKKLIIKPFEIKKGSDDYCQNTTK